MNVNKLILLIYKKGLGLLGKWGRVGLSMEQSLSWSWTTLEGDRF